MSACYNELAFFFALNLLRRYVCGPLVAHACNKYFAICEGKSSHTPSFFPTAATVMNAVGLGNGVAEESGNVVMIAVEGTFEG